MDAPLPLVLKVLSGPFDGVRVRLGAVLEADGVVRVSPQELVALGITDDVVRRTGEVGEVGNPGGRGVGVIREPHPVGYAGAAEAIEGVVEPGEGRDAGHRTAV